MSGQDYQIEFDDGTSTIIYVKDDEIPSEAAEQACDDFGWDTNSVVQLYPLPPKPGWDDPTTDTRAF